MSEARSLGACIQRTPGAGAAGRCLLTRRSEGVSTNDSSPEKRNVAQPKHSPERKYYTEPKPTATDRSCAAPANDTAAGHPPSSNKCSGEVNTTLATLATPCPAHTTRGDAR